MSTFIFSTCSFALHLLCLYWMGCFKITQYPHLSIRHCLPYIYQFRLLKRERANLSKLTVRFRSTSMALAFCSEIGRDLTNTKLCLRRMSTFALCCKLHRTPRTCGHEHMKKLACLLANRLTWSVTLVLRYSKEDRAASCRLTSLTPA